MSQKRVVRKYFYNKPLLWWTGKDSPTDIY